MEKTIKFWIPGLSLTILLGFISFTAITRLDNSAINGAWKLQQGTVEQVLIFSDGYFMHTTFNKTKKQFVQSRGGAYKFAGNKLATSIEFNTQLKDQIGQSINYDFVVNKDRLSTDLGGKKEAWKLLDKGDGVMAGTWRSSGRMQDGKVVLNPPRARKTFKILTGTRFQWAAINAETKEFFGTGGGTYTFTNGKYTESIEFFSRDSSRVGASLTFDGKLEEGNWHHSGMSSKGTPIYEIWRMEPKQ